MLLRYQWTLTESSVNVFLLTVDARTLLFKRSPKTVVESYQCIADIESVGERWSVEQIGYRSLRSNHITYARYCIVCDIL